MTTLNLTPTSPALDARVEPDIADTIVQIFADHLAIEIEHPEIDLVDEGLLDSLAVVDLLMQLERSFGFTVVMEELDLEDLRTIRSIESFVRRNTN